MTYEAPANSSFPYELPQAPPMEGLPEEVQAYCAQLEHGVEQLIESLKKLQTQSSKR